MYDSRKSRYGSLWYVEYEIYMPLLVQACYEILGVNFKQIAAHNAFRLFLAQKMCYTTY